MSFFRDRGRLLIFLGLTFLVGLILLFQVYSSIQQQQEEEEQIKLESAHRDAVTSFKLRLNDFSIMVAGLRAHINSHDSEITEDFLINYMENQLKDLDFKDSLVISYIDADQFFIASVNKTKPNSAGLVGMNVRELRSEDKVQRLDEMMQSDSLRLFDPINLVEGWVGVPIDFGVLRNGKSIGYIAALINFKTVIDAVYSAEVLNNYVFHFSFGDGIDFDRALVYGDAKRPRTDIEPDPEYYKNFEIPESNFIYDEFELHGQKFRIGAARKDVEDKFDWVLFLLALWFLTIFMFLALLVSQLRKITRLHSAVRTANEDLIGKNREIEAQNVEMETLNKTKTKFFRIIAHDLKGPMGALDGALQLLNMERFSSTETRGLIKEMGNSSSNILKLLLNLLDWSRIQTGEISMEPENLNVLSLVRETIQLLKPQAKEKSVILAYWPEEPAYAYCDSNTTLTILRNLISNALKFTPKYGRVNVTIDDYPDVVKITVSDTGIGMSEEQVKNLFEIDKQHRREGTSGEKGTGLGLLLVKDLVALQGGTLSVMSKEGEGSAFDFTIPKKS